MPAAVKVALHWLTHCHKPVARIPKCCAGPMELDLESVASACLTQSGEAAANVGLLRSCIQGSADPAAALVKALKVFTSKIFSQPCEEPAGWCQASSGHVCSSSCPAAVLQLPFAFEVPHRTYVDAVTCSAATFETPNVLCNFKHMHPGSLMRTLVGIS